MIYTHIYDFILKVILLFATIFIVVNIPYFEQQEDGIQAIITVLIVCIILYLGLIRSLGTYLYCRINLKMPVSFTEAKRLNAALSPNPYRSRTWLPLKEVLALEDGLKYSTALNILANWQENKITKHKLAVKQFKDSPKSTKIFEVVIVALITISFICSFLNLPPASYVIQLYCNIFETEKYFPMLIGGLMTLVICLIGIGIKRIFKP